MPIRGKTSYSPKTRKAMKDYAEAQAPKKKKKLKEKAGSVRELMRK